MNLLFLTLSNMNSISQRGIYADLMRKFRDEGHNVFIVSPCERRNNQPTHVLDVDGVKLLKVKTLNIQKTNILEKGLGTLLIEKQYIKAIKEYFSGVEFDLITYSTPPITFTNAVKYLKKNNPNAISYLQLKDIFPQNAVDIGMFGKKSAFNWFFRRKEKELYKASDFIGCMSPANVNYILEHNDYIDKSKVEVAPNSIELKEKVFEEGQEKAERYYIRKKYDLPTDKTIFIYGGNLGKPQGIGYLIKCLEANKNRQDCYFVVVGSGTEYPRLKAWYDNLNHNEYSCVKLMQGLPKEDYDMLVRYCDVGLIFLDHRFTIPNYPSRLLSYLENKMPIICATDVNTDIGKIAEENGYGYWCESNSVEAFTSVLDKMLVSDRKNMGERGFDFLMNNYLVENTYNAIMSHV